MLRSGDRASTDSKCQYSELKTALLLSITISLLFGYQMAHFRSFLSSEQHYASFTGSCMQSFCGFFVSCCLQIGAAIKERPPHFPHLTMGYRVCCVTGTSLFLQPLNMAAAKLQRACDCRLYNYFIQTTNSDYNALTKRYIYKTTHKYTR